MFWGSSRFATHKYSSYSYNNDLRPGFMSPNLQLDCQISFTACWAAHTREGPARHHGWHKKHQDTCQSGLHWSIILQNSGTSYCRHTTSRRSRKMVLNVVYCTQNLYIGRGAVATRLDMVMEFHFEYINAPWPCAGCLLQTNHFANEPFRISVHPNGNGRFHVSMDQNPRLSIEKFKVGPADLHQQNSTKTSSHSNHRIFWMNASHVTTTTTTTNLHPDLFFLTSLLHQEWGNDLFLSRMVGPEFLSWINWAHRVCKLPSGRPCWTISSYIPVDPTCTRSGMSVCFVASNHMVVNTALQHIMAIYSISEYERDHPGLPIEICPSQSAPHPTSDCCHKEFHHQHWLIWHVSGFQGQ